MNLNWCLLVFFAALLWSCKKVECSSDARLLSDEEKKVAFWNQGDTLRFVHKTDTFNLYSFSKSYYQKTQLNKLGYIYNSSCKDGGNMNYWELESFFTSTIPVTDTTKLQLKVNLSSHVDLREEFLQTFIFYDKETEFKNSFSFFVRPDSNFKLFTRSTFDPFNVKALNQSNVTFFEEKTFNGKTYKHVNKLSGDLIVFDSVFYTRKEGIIRMVNKTYDLNLIP